MADVTPEALAHALSGIHIAFTDPESGDPVVGLPAYPESLAEMALANITARAGTALPPAFVEGHADPEVRTMGVIAAHLEPLNDVALRRVMRYLVDRFGDD